MYVQVHSMMILLTQLYGEYLFQDMALRVLVSQEYL